MIEVLKESAQDLHPNEVYFMKDYICERILDEEEAAIHPLCMEFEEHKKTIEKEKLQEE